MRKLYFLLLLAGCGGRMPETRYYDLPSSAHGHVGQGPRTERSPCESDTRSYRMTPWAPVLAVEPLEVDEPYDDDRMVYRENPYRVDYYHYHRWSASPGALVSRHLERALAASGRFAAVLRDEDARGVTFILGGRLLALEEVDLSKHRWVARVALELALRDAASGDVVWTRRVELTEPVARQSPEGVARALSRALDRAARRLAPELVAVAAAPK